MYPVQGPRLVFITTQLINFALISGLKSLVGRVPSDNPDHTLSSGSLER